MLCVFLGTVLACTVVTNFLVLPLRRSLSGTHTVFTKHLFMYWTLGIQGESARVAALLELILMWGIQIRDKYMEVLT